MSNRPSDAENSDLRALWLAVIQQATIDATTPLNKVMKERLERRRAREWFINAGSNFRSVCECAGVEPDRLHKQVLPLIVEASKNDSPMPDPKPRKPRIRLGQRQTPSTGQINP